MECPLKHIWGVGDVSNDSDKRFLVELNTPIYRSIIDINTDYLDQYLGIYQSEEEYAITKLFNNLSNAVKKANPSCDLSLNTYTIYGDYGSLVDVETTGRNSRRLRIHSYLQNDSDELVDCFELLEGENISQIQRRSEITNDRTKKYRIYPLVMSKYLQNTNNLITLDVELRRYINMALNFHFKASDVFFDENKDEYFLMCALFVAVSAENRMWLVYENLTRGNPEKKTLGLMIEKSYAVDQKRVRKLFTRAFKSNLLDLNGTRIKTVHPSTRPLHFPDDAINALVCLGELLVRCNDHGF